MAHTTQIHNFFNSNIESVKLGFKVFDEELQSFIDKFLPHDKPITSIVNSILVSAYQIFISLPFMKLFEIACIVARFLELIVIAGDKTFDVAKNCFTHAHDNTALAP